MGSDQIIIPTGLLARTEKESMGREVLGGWGGQNQAKELDCFFHLSPPGLEMECYDIFTFLHGYWSLHWPLLGDLIRKLIVSYRNCRKKGFTISHTLIWIGSIT